MAKSGKRAELEQVHDVYRENLKEWEFFGRAYRGGRHWQEAELLYRYHEERRVSYSERLRQTPMDNHCKSVVHTYSGFIWREPPKRSFGSLENNRALLAMAVNADKQECSLNEFMKSSQEWASVFGVCWIVMDKPAAKVRTKADEIERDVRPYLRLYFPEHVLDWDFMENPFGKLELTYLKVREGLKSAGDYRYRIWTPKSVEVWRATRREEPVLESTMVNPIGVVPAVPHYNTKPLMPGLAISDLQDVARVQMSLYNDLSELSQMIRGSNHKTLVKNAKDDASTGAGGVIVMDEDTLPAKKPYLLQADADALGGLLNAMERKVEMINRMAHLTPLRQYRTQISSAVAIETEFQILNTLLAQKAAQLELTENRLFRIFCRWEGTDFDQAKIEIIYPVRFELRDRGADLEYLTKAKGVAEKIESPTLRLEIDRQLARLVLERDDVLEVVERELRGAVVVSSGGGG